MNIIETIYQNSIQPSERKMLRDTTYSKAKNKEKQCYDKLCEKLSDENLAILNKLVSSYEKKLERKNIHCFTAGFKKGLSIAVASLME